MANFTCAISGITYSITGMNLLYTPQTIGYYHPVFTITHKDLYKAYSLHCKGELSSLDSYLLFLAFLNYSSCIEWNHPATLNPDDPDTIKLIENNISQLVRVLELTDAIKHPKFKQPKFSVNEDNSDLAQIPNWIEAWEYNIENWKLGLATIREQEELQKVENKLTYHILSGAQPKEYSAVIANWACRAAEFPPSVADYWKSIIRTCFNSTKMFNTPLKDIKECEEFCHSNIEAGSIHFHELCKVLNTGIKNHVDYLGISSVLSEFTILPNVCSDTSVKASTIINNITSSAPSKEPIESEYSSKIEYIKAKLAWRINNTHNTHNTNED